MEARSHVLDDHSISNKTLRKEYEKIVEEHRQLVLHRDKERLRVVRGLPPPKSDPKDRHPVLYGPIHTLANLQYRFLPNYSVVRRVLTEAQSLIPNLRPTRVLDFGMGSGAASAAAADVFPGLEWIHGVDSSRTMQECAIRVLEGYTQCRVTATSHLSASEQASFDVAIMAYTALELVHNEATMAAVALLWEKLRPGGILVVVEPGIPDGFSTVRTIRNMLLDCCPDDCHLIAPCTHNGPCPMERYQKLLDERRTQVDVEEQKEGVVFDVDSDDDEDDPFGDMKMIDEEPNDASSDDEVTQDEEVTEDDEDDNTEDDGLQKGFCSFVQTMPGSSFLHKGEKFTYLVAQKRTTSADGHAFDDVDLPNTLERAFSASGVEREELLQEAINLESRYLDSDEDELGLEMLRGENIAGFGRIIQAPLKRKGHILIDCCTAPGKIVRHKISKSSNKAAPGVYHSARKSRWGGLWPATQSTEVPTKK